MKSRTLWPVIIVIVILAAIAFIGYRLSRNPSAVPAPTNATSTAPSDAVIPAPQDRPVLAFAAALPFPSATSTPGDGWKKYSSKGGAYALYYPNDLLSSVDGQGALTLIFPKNAYFDWPLLDDATVKITSGLSCPALLAGPGAEASSTFTLNGIDWTRTVGFDVGAGNRYQEVAYDTVSNGTCYHIALLDHGTNGSGFYVDDASLVKRYDAVHDADVAHVIDVLNTMVASFRILAAPK